ncbi:hypothetical protein [Gracilimonas sediminicola]|uniref:hypothetical protein n=1 Tax=Gracilimonas sediminicola TaxID=2952158 RepID=UPI0038D4E48A
MNQKNLAYRELKYPFFTELAFLNEHFGDNYKYAELLAVLNAYIFKNNDFPFQKELLKSLKLKREELVQLMNELYRDFQDLMSKRESYIIQDTEIQFIARDSPEIWIVSPANLKILPRLGDTVYLPTLTRDHKGASYFKVDEIIHEISGGKHLMEIHLMSPPVELEY